MLRAIVLHAGSSHQN